MSDARLRELERRWRESGSVEDEAAYLRERVRVGDLRQDRLELAAYCGHEAAARISGAMGPKDLVDWVRGLRAFGRETWVSSIHASLMARVSSWNDSPGRRALIDRLTQWPLQKSSLSADDHPKWSAEWEGVTRHEYEAVQRAVRCLSEENAAVWKAWAGIPLVLKAGVQPRSVIDSLSAAGARASTLDDKVVLLDEMGISLTSVVRIIIKATDLNPPEAVDLARRSALVVWVFEAWSFGSWDGRRAVLEFALGSCRPELRLDGN